MLLLIAKADVGIPMGIVIKRRQVCLPRLKVPKTQVYKVTTFSKIIMKITENVICNSDENFSINFFN